MKKLATATCLAVLLGTSSAAIGAEGTFQFGPQVGFSKTKATVSMSGASGSGSDTAPSGGLIARYIVPMNDNGLFMGVQVGIVRESANKKYSAVNASGSLSQETTAEWSMDLMPMVGYRIGRTSLSVAAGFSSLYGDIERNAQSGASFISSKDSNWHIGWKVAPGIDYQISENVTLFSQAYYAEYGSASYNISGSSIDLELETYGTRFGVLYSF